MRSNLTLETRSPVNGPDDGRVHFRVGAWGVTFQSVDRRTHECYWFLSRQRHLDGRLRDHQQVACTTSGCAGLGEDHRNRHLAAVRSKDKGQQVLKDTPDNVSGSEHTRSPSRFAHLCGLLRPKRWIDEKVQIVSPTMSWMKIMLIHNIGDRRT